MVKLNDSLQVLYAVVMLVALFAPSLFFSSNYSYYRGGVFCWLAGVLLVYPTIKRIDISQNLWRWVLVGLVSVSVFGLLFDKAADLPFNSMFSALVWYIVVVGMSETLIMVGLAQKLLNPYVTVVLMGVLHVTAYMLAFGVSTFMSWLIFAACVKAVVGFAIYYFLYAKTGDVGAVSVVHGTYDFALGV